MEKKGNAAPAHPLGVCEKLYNAFISGPSLIPLRRPRLTSGANSHVVDGHHHSDGRGSLPPAAATKDSQQKTAGVGAVALPKEVAPPPKEKSATKPPEPEPPQLPKDQEKNTNVRPPVTKLPTMQATIPEKQNVQQSATPTRPEMTGRGPTYALRVATEKGKEAAPAVPAPSPSPPPPPAAALQGKAAPPPPAPPAAQVVQVKAPPPPPAVLQGKAAPPPPAPPAAQVVQVKAPPPPPAVLQGKAAPPPPAPPAAPVVQAKAPPPPPPAAAPPTTAAPAAPPAVAADKSAPVAEMGKAAANINERSENFIRRARNSWRSSSAVGGTRKQS